MKNYIFRIGIVVLLSFILTGCIIVATNDYIFFKPLKNTVLNDDVLFVKNSDSFELNNGPKSVLKKFLKPISKKQYISFVPDDKGTFNIYVYKLLMTETINTKENAPYLIDKTDYKNAVVSFVGENQGIQYFNISVDSNDGKKFSEECFKRSIKSIIESRNITLNKSIIKSQNLKKIMDYLTDTIYNNSNISKEMVSVLEKCMNPPISSESSAILNFMIAFDPKTKILYIIDTPKLISSLSKDRKYASAEYRKNIYESLPELNIYSKYSHIIGKQESSFLGLKVGAREDLTKAMLMKLTDELLFILTNK